MSNVPIDFRFRARDTTQATFGRLFGNIRKTEAATRRLSGAERQLSAARASAVGQTRAAANANLLFNRQLKSGAAALLGASTAAYAAVRGFQSYVNVLREMQRYQFVIDNVAGNATEGAAAFDFVRDTANRLGLELGALTDGYSKLAAATKPLGFSTAELQELFLGTASAAAAFRLTADRTSLVFIALSQIASKGVVSMEELRRQLSEHLPGALQTAAEAMQVTVPELRKLVESGDLLSSTFLRALGPKFLAKHLADGAKAANTLDGALNRASNAWRELILAADSSPTLIKTMNLWIETLNRAAVAIGGVDAVAVKLSKTEGATIDGLRKVREELERERAEIMLNLSPSTLTFFDLIGISDNDRYKELSDKIKATTEAIANLHRAARDRITLPPPSPSPTGTGDVGAQEILPAFEDASRHLAQVNKIIAAYDDLRSRSLAGLITVSPEEMQANKVVYENALARKDALLGVQQAERSIGEIVQDQLKTNLQNARVREAYKKAVEGLTDAEKELLGVLEQEVPKNMTLREIAMNRIADAVERKHLEEEILRITDAETRRKLGLQTSEERAIERLHEEIDIRFLLGEITSKEVALLKERARLLETGTPEQRAHATQQIEQEENARQFARSIAGDFIDRVREGKNVFESVFFSIADGFTDRIASKLQDKLADFAFDVLLGGAGGGGGLLGRFFGGGRASGGPVRAGHLYRINERGDEYILPTFDGMVYPSNTRPGGMGGGQVTVNQYNDFSGLTRDESMALIDRQASVTKSELLNLQERGRARTYGGR